MTITSLPDRPAKKRRRRCPLLSNAEVRRRTQLLMWLHAEQLHQGADVRQQAGTEQAERLRAEQEAERLRNVVAEIRRQIPAHAALIDTITATPAEA